MGTIKVAAAKLRGRKVLYLLSFLGGAAVTLGFTSLGKSNPPDHVFELRLYQVNDGKMDELIARFRDHTDAIFKRHNMKIAVKLRRSNTACPICVCTLGAPSEISVEVPICAGPAECLVFTRQNRR